MSAIPKTTKYLATLTYSSFVDEFLSGTYDLEFSREEDADEFARGIKDREIQIRYKASNPKVSCPDAFQIQHLAVATTPLWPSDSSFNRLAGMFRPTR